MALPADAFDALGPSAGRRRAPAARPIALLGPTPYILSAFASPLVGLAGRHDAAPMGAVIALFDAAALAAFAVLAGRSEE